VAPPGLIGEAVVVGGASGVGAAIYGGLAVMLGIQEIRLLRTAVERGLNRLTGRGV
jgi:hypothetical protein